MPRIRSTTERGYGARHQALRRAYEPAVKAGRAYCTEPICLKTSRWIRPGSRWDLAHGATRDTYRGPAHMSCNRSEGARRRNANAKRRTRTAAHTPARTSRQW